MEAKDDFIAVWQPLLAAVERNRQNPSFLQIGCADGANLEFVAKRGWRCFGIERATERRATLKQQYGNTFYIVEDVEALIPHEFDQIVIFDIYDKIEKITTLFYELFAKGAITPQTMIVLTIANPDLVSDVTTLLQRLHFTSIQYLDITQDAVEPGKSVSLLCIIQGSDFKEFMQERYVPGTWSKLAEYEHMPRYHFARNIAKGANVLDFGCGTGYGAALMSEVAEQVTGVDIDAAALTWAVQTHQSPSLTFERREDLAKGMNPSSFNLITCFEMIEHVAEDMQIELVHNFSQLLAPGGKLLISTPNPEITANYGENPFHIREMTETEFLTLLQTNFKYVRIMRQWISPAVYLAQAFPKSNGEYQQGLFQGSKVVANPPLAYIAICSNEPVTDMPAIGTFDFSFDYIANNLSLVNKLNSVRFENYTLSEAAIASQRQRDEQIAAQLQVLQEKDLQIAAQLQAMQEKDLQIAAQVQAMQEQAEHIHGILASKSWKITKPLRWGKSAIDRFTK